LLVRADERSERKVLPDDPVRSGHVTPLREELKRRFYPFLAERGFRPMKRESRHFVTFHRDAARAGHSFELQWDKYDRPHFVLNFGSAGAAAGMPQLSGRLQRRRGGSVRCWFGLHRSWWSRIRSGRWSHTPTEAVDEVIAAFAELEAWWLRGEAGPHIYISELHV
jgi:hypothetical protein